MFNWNVEDMKLLTMARVGEGYDKAFSCESEVSIEDKFEFVDRMQDGKLTYFYDMVKNFGEAIPSMKKDGNGKPTDYAKKAWVRKNDSKELFCRTTDSYNNYGDFNLLGCKLNLFTYHISFERTRKTFKEIVINKLFHNQLKKCKDMEYNHFYDQNETVQFLDEFKCKYSDHNIWLLEDHFDLEVKVAQNPSQKNKVVVTTCSAGYTDYKDKELSIEEIQQIDAELTKLDDLRAKIEKAEQAYEEAKLSVAEKIKSMAG